VHSAGSPPVGAKGIAVSLRVELSKINCKKFGAVEKVRFYPQTPQGGLSKLLYFNKSPLGVPIAIGIGVSQRKLTFSTALLLLQKEEKVIIIYFNTFPSFYMSVVMHKRS
jgi:hypothetical protein